MPGTRVHQLRSMASTDAGAVYTITAACTLPGTLPDASLFLVKAVSLTDPKDDQFVRLCSAADFVTYGTDRDAAWSVDGNYRTARVTFRYTDVATANDAWQTISARINDLVNSYDVFLTAFLTRDEGVDTSYPTIDLSEKTARITTYRARVAAVATAEASRDEHMRSCHDPKSLALETAQRELAQATNDLAAVRPIRTAVDVLAASYPAGGAAIGTSLAAALASVIASSATGPEKETIQSQLTAAQNGVTTLSGYDTRLIVEVQTPLAAFVGALESRTTDLTQQVLSAQNELAACNVEMARLQGEVDEARRARDAALASVREVCVDFTGVSDTDGTLAAALALLLGGE